MKCWTKLKSRTKARRRRNFFTDFVAIARIQLIKFWTQLKIMIDESSPQAKFFYRLYRNRTHTINEILHEIEKQNRRKLAAGEFFFRFIAIARTQLMKFWTKLKSRIDESSPQAKFFYSLCHNRTHIINEILNEIEKQNRRKLAVGEFFTAFVTIAHK